MFELISIVEDPKRKIVKMNEMEPLQIGRIVNGKTYDFHIVMRTADVSHIEVMDLSIPGPDNCWSSPDIDILADWDVELLPKGTEIILKVK